MVQDRDSPPQEGCRRRPMSLLSVYAPHRPDQVCLRTWFTITSA